MWISNLALWLLLRRHRPAADKLTLTETPA